MTSSDRALSVLSFTSKSLMHWKNECHLQFTQHTIARLQSRLGEGAFSYAGPLAWNSLPADLQNIPDTLTFKKRLKTYLFNSAF